MEIIEGSHFLAFEVMMKSQKVGMIAATNTDRRLISKIMVITVTRAIILTASAKITDNFMTTSTTCLSDEKIHLKLRDRNDNSKEDCQL